jgi:membrane dipeptidase
MYHGAREQIAGAVFRHIDYIAQLVGTECVGFGIDAMRNTTAVAEFMQGRPEEWPDVLKSDWRGIETLQPEMLVDLTECMLKAGYPQASIREILGENFRRLCAAVWPKTSS